MVEQYQIPGSNTLDTITGDMQKQAATNQQFQAANLDAQQKQLAYAAQVMSAASAPIAQDANGQPIFNDAMVKSAKQHLNGFGIDTSMFGDTGAEAYQQSQGLRQALMSPAAMLNSQIQLQRNGIMAAGANSTTAPTTLPRMGAALPVVGAAPSATTMQPNGLTPAEQAIETGRMAPAAANGVQAPAGMQVGGLPVSAANVNATGQAVNDQNKPVQMAMNTFTPSPAPPNESPKGRIERINAELAQWKANNEANPAFLQQQKQAEAQGTAAGALPEKSAASTELFGRIEQNLDAMLKINPDVPQQGMILSAEQQAGLSQRGLSGDNQNAANAYNAFTKVNKAQVLNGIQDLVQSGSIRNSRALIDLVDHVNAIDVNASPASRAQQIGAVRAELQNLMISSQNINADLNGGVKQPYQQIPMGTTQTPQAGAIMDSPSLGKVVFMGGDPTDKNNYKKAQ